MKKCRARFLRNLYTIHDILNRPFTTLCIALHVLLCCCLSLYYHYLDLHWFWLFMVLDLVGRCLFNDLSMLFYLDTNEIY
jgi:hypothetical protein